MTPKTVIRRTSFVVYDLKPEGPVDLGCPDSNDADFKTQTTRALCGTLLEVLILLGNASHL